MELTLTSKNIVKLANNLYESIKPCVAIETFFINYNSFNTIKLLLPFYNIYLELKEFRVNSFCGFLFIDDLETTLVVNKNHLPSRQLFTTAHELGHFFMHKEQKNEFLENGLTEKIYSYKDQIMEKQANLFASELLVPKEVLTKMLSMKFTFYRIYKTIGVSKEAFRWRLSRYLIERYNIHFYFANLLINDYFTKSINKDVENSYIFFMDNNIHLQREILAELKGEESVFYIYKEIALTKECEYRRF